MSTFEAMESPASATGATATTARPTIKAPSRAYRRGEISPALSAPFVRMASLLIWKLRAAKYAPRLNDDCCGRTLSGRYSLIFLELQHAPSADLLRGLHSIEMNPPTRQCPMLIHTLSPVLVPSRYIATPRAAR